MSFVLIKFVFSKKKIRRLKFITCTSKQLDFHLCKLNLTDFVFKGIFSSSFHATQKGRNFLTVAHNETILGKPKARSLKNMQLKP